MGASGFNILPAIDLRGGRVVRLRQGDFGRETAYSDDPVATARSFADAGARWLHVVDLDAARSGSPAHGETIRAIVADVGERCAVEVAGGLRSADSVGSVLVAGARRAVIGTAALRDPSFVERLVAEHGPDRIAVALDVRDGLAVGHGWAAGAAGMAPDDALSELSARGVTTFEVTAIDRDGTLAGPDLALYERLFALHAGSVIASGGVATHGDIEAVRAIGCAGVIVGRAIYDGRIRIDELAW